MRSSIILFWAVLILSQAGNIIRFCQAEALAIAFYRLLMALFLLLPFSIGQWKGLKLSPLVLVKVVAMGLFFALHFISWIMAIQSTKVANAATCLSLTPVFVALGAYFFLKEKISKAVIIAIVFGILGVLVLGLEDFQLNSSYIWGDLLALSSGIFLSSYWLIGKSLRRLIGNLPLMCMVYFVASLFVLMAAMLFGTALTGFSLSTQVALLILAIFPTVLGHASLIYVMKDFKSSFIAVVTLVEPILAGIGAMYLFGEKITLPMATGYTIIVLGLLVLIYSPAGNKKKAHL